MATQSVASPDSAAPPERRALFPYLVLFGGVLMVSSASIMIRLAQQHGVPSITIAAGRMGLAALILLPVALLRASAELRTLARRDWLLGGASGAVLALHFATWISSLEYTSVASSVALVTTNPLWVALASALLFRERLAPAAWLGVLLTISGSALIGLSDSSGGGGSNVLLGDGLALLGALSASAYFLAGRELRKRMSLLAYIWLSYSSAALVLLPIALLTGWGGPPPAAGGAVLLGLAPAAWPLLLGLAVGPQLLGHTSFNWALRYLSATFIAVSILGEPIASALLALLLFREQFAPLQLAGFVTLLLGIAIALRAERSGVERKEQRTVNRGPDLGA